MTTRDRAFRSSAPRGRGGFRSRFARRASLAVLICLTAVGGVQADDWLQFRGPEGQGHSAAVGLPLQWGPQSNIRWKAPLPGEGWSSPIVWNGRVYLTAAVPNDERPGAPLSLHTICLDAATGNLLWNVEIFSLQEGGRAQKHSKNSHASPTPVSDGTHLFVHFGTQGTACLTADGDVVWKTRALEFLPQHGCGNSPILVDDLLFVNCDGSDVQFVAALDKATGDIRWKKDRPPVNELKKFAFATPLLIEAAGQRQIVSPGAHHVVAYRPADGEELWRVRYHGYSLVPRPVYGHGLVFVCTGYDRPQLLAIRPTGSGDVTDSAVAWRIERGAPNTPSPLLIGDELYFVSDRGIATCVDARTGKVHWTERIGGNFSASPLFADGKIYLQSETGVTIVIRPGLTFEELGRNAMNAATLASLAVDGHGLLLRTENAVYRVESD